MSKILNLDDCLVLRGMAITSIFLHNYCHLIPDAAHENEFYYSEENNSYFWNHLLSSDIIVQLFSYLGHLGVPVFVFLTGYGLSKKYGMYTDVGINTFIWNHYKKFFFPMLFGMISYIIIYGLIHANLWDGWIQTFCAQMTLTNNMVFHPDWFIKPGPYWYFGMTMQLYIIYRLLVYKRSTYMLTLLVLLSIFIFVLLESKHYSLIWFKYNSMGWLFPFGIGIWLSKIIECPMVREWQWFIIMIISIISILLFGFNYYLWLLIPIVVLLFFYSICKLMKGYCYKVFHFIGNTRWRN